MNHLVLSGTPAIVPSGTRSTCYRGPKSGENSCLSKACRASNLSNLNSFGIYLTNFAFSPVGEKTRAAAAERVRIVALLNQNGGVDKTTVTLDSVAGWWRQRLQVVVIDADRKGENENCWLDWSKQHAKKGLTRPFDVIGLTPGAPPRLEALEIACMVGRVVSGEPPRFAVRMRSALLVTDVALTPFQPSPSGEGEPVEIQQASKKGADPPPRTSTLASSAIATSLAALNRPRKSQGGRQARLANAVGPRRSARGVRESCVQQSIPLEAPERRSRNAGR